MDSCPIVNERNIPTIPNVDERERIAEHLNSVHSCTHKFALSKTTPGTIYQQIHCGVYASIDERNNWQDISNANKDRHGFPIVATGQRKESIFVIPAYQGECKKHNSCIKGDIKVNKKDSSGKGWK